MDKGIIRQVSLTTAASFYCDWLDWLRIIILANISIEKVRHFILSWSGPGVKSRTLTWNTEGPLRCLGGVFSQYAFWTGFWSTVNRSSAFSIPFFASPWKRLGDIFKSVCNIHLYMKKCTKTSCLNISCERRLHFRGMSWRAKSS